MRQVFVVADPLAWTLEWAKAHPMSDVESHEQAESWVNGQLSLSDVKRMRWWRNYRHEWAGRLLSDVRR